MAWASVLVESSRLERSSSLTVEFHRPLAIERPLLVDAWSGRFIVQAEEGDELIEVYYRPDDGGERIIERTDPRLERFIQFLGHMATIERPVPGLGLSYSQTIGALHQIWRNGYIKADFKAEQDRVLAAILRQQQRMSPEQRPEFSDPDFDEVYPRTAPGEGADEPTSDLDQLAPPPDINSAARGG